MKDFTNKQIRMKLKEAGLNPDDLSFIHEPAYAPFRNSHFMWTEVGRETIDYYVWRNWFSKTQKNKVKPGVFDIGVSKKPKNMTDMMLYREIAEEETGDHEYIRQRIIGEKSSLKSKLRDELGFRIDQFGPEQDYEKLKLYKLLYWYEKSPLNPMKISIISILSTPSIANQDQRLLGKESPYGKLLTELKFEVRKEVDERFAMRVSADTLAIMRAWDVADYNVTHLVNRRDIPVEDIMTELNRIKAHLDSVFTRLDSDRNLEDYADNLMEAFYLKVHQLDYIARIHDINKAIAHVCDSEHTRYLLSHQGNKSFTFKDCVITDIEAFMSENLERVTKLAYQNEDVSKSDMVHIQKKVERVEVLLSIYNKQRRSEVPQMLTLSFLIATLQEILLVEHPGEDDSEAFFTNAFYKSKRTARTLNSALKNFDEAHSFEEEIFEIIWVTKIERRLYAFRGRLEPYLLSVKIGGQINRIVSFLTSVPHLDRMSMLHNYFIDQIFLTEKKTIGQYQRDFQTAVRENTGYDCIIRSQRVFSLFDNKDQRLFFTDLIINGINGQYDFAGWGRDGVYYKANVMNHHLVMEINHGERRFVLHRFMPIVSDEEIAVMQKSGLTKLMIT